MTTDCVTMTMRVGGDGLRLVVRCGTRCVVYYVRISLMGVVV